MRTWKIRLTALVLLVCLLLGGCERWNGELPNYYTPDYIPFSEMEYSRPNMAVLDTAIQEVEERVNSGVGFSSVVSSINYFLTCYYEYYTNLNLANIHYCADLTDTYWETEYYYCSELTPTVESKLDDVCGIMEKCGAVSGFTVTHKSRYPGWKFRTDSAIQSIYKESSKACFCKEGKIIGIHAGLECGLLSEKIPEMDMLSIGPNMYDIHTPKERLSLSSSSRVCALVLDMLKRI